MNHLIRYSIGIVGMLAALVAVPTSARAGHDVPALAAELVCATTDLENEIRVGFTPAPNFRCLFESAVALRVAATEVKCAINAGQVGPELRSRVHGIERGAHQLEHELEEIDYRRCGIDGHCRNHAEKLADRVEDTADDLFDSLKNYRCQVAVPVPQPVPNYPAYPQGPVYQNQLPAQPSGYYSPYPTNSYRPYGADGYQADYRSSRPSVYRYDPVPTIAPAGYSVRQPELRRYRPADVGYRATPSFAYGVR